jgi:hypothetical protein
LLNYLTFDRVSQCGRQEKALGEEKEKEVGFSAEKAELEMN